MKSIVYSFTKAEGGEGHLQRVRKTTDVEWVFLYKKHLIKIISDFESPSVLMKSRAIRKKKGSRWL